MAGEKLRLPSWPQPDPTGALEGRLECALLHGSARRWGWPPHQCRRIQGVSWGTHFQERRLLLAACSSLQVRASGPGASSFCTRLLHVSSGPLSEGHRDPPQPLLFTHRIHSPIQPLPQAFH